MALEQASGKNDSKMIVEKFLKPDEIKTGDFARFRLLTDHSESKSLENLRDHCAAIHRKSADHAGIETKLQPHFVAANNLIFETKP